MVRFHGAAISRVRSVPAWSTWILRVLGLGLAYYITGRLALSLAIPPGYATAVWPAAGLSLVALLHFGNSVWPGIWLGSFLVTSGAGSDLGTQDYSLAFSAIAATGGVLQALAGAAVVRRFVGFPNELIHVRDIAMFMMLGGPATCLISSTISMSALWWTGRVAASDVPFNWFTWWVGDAIGVIASTALLLVWSPNIGRNTQYRRWVITLPVLAAATLVVILFVFTSRREQARLSEEVRQHAATVADTLAHRFDYSVEALFALRTLARRPEVFEREDFVAAASDFLARRASVQALSWNPRAPPRSDPATASNHTHPLVWTVPGNGADNGAGTGMDIGNGKGNEERRAGFDPASDPRARAAMERACATGEISVSGPMPLEQSTSPQSTFVVLPVIPATPTPALVPATTCHERLLGMFVAAYRLDRLLEATLGPTGLQWFRYRLVDDADGSAPLYDSAKVVKGHPAAFAFANLASSATLRLADRRLTLHVLPTPAFINSRRSLQAWSILAGGLLFTSALACIMLVVTGHATAALLLSESRDRALFEQSAAGIVELSTSGRLLRANQRFCDMVGRSLDELRRLHLADITHPDDHEADVERFQQALQSTLPEGGWTKRYVRPDGSIVWVRVSGSVVRDSRGQLAYLVGVVHDITQFVNVQRALAHSRSHLMAFVEHVPAAAAMLDRDLRYVAVSRRFREDYKLGGRDLTGLHHYDVFPEIHQRPEWRAVHQRSLAGSIERSAEDHFAREDGREEWIQWEVRPWFDETDAIGGIIMLSEIITARKQAAEELQRSEARLRLTIDSASLGLWEWDLRTAQVTADENWWRIMGYAPGADRPTDVAELWRNSIHPDDWIRLVTLLEQHRHGAGDESFDIDYRATRKDGREIWLNSRGRFDRRNADGNPLHMIGTIQDVSERKRAEELIRASLTEKEVLLREIHHRVKNNLAVVASLFYLQSTTSEQPEVVQVFEESRNRILSMALVHDHLYRSDRLSAVDFAEYATELSRQLLRSYGRPGRDIQLTTSFTPLRLSVDVAIPCGLVLNELLTNCLKHAFNGARDGQIEVGLVRLSGATYELRVSDDGVGTSGADLSGTHSLGLRLVRSLAGQLNGTLDIEPRARGTSARLTFTL
jgi:PAS domain S-box-containing protein